MSNETEMARLKLEQAKTELEQTKMELEISRLEKERTFKEVALTRGSIHSQRAQLMLNLVALVAAVSAMGTSWRTSSKSEAVFDQTNTAVQVINSNQQEQHEQVEELRSYAVALGSASAVALLPVPPPASTTTRAGGSAPKPAASEAMVIVRVESSATPPPPAPPPVSVALPRY